MGASVSEPGSPAGAASPGSPADAARALWREGLAGIQRGEVLNAELTNRQLGPREVRELCQALASSGSVKALELDGNRIGDEGAAHLAETLARGPDINFVDLTNNCIGDAGATALASRLGGNCALHHLDLASNEIKGFGGLALGRMLTVNSGIRQLTLCGNALGAEGARAIGLALPSNRSLRILNIHSCGLGPEGARLIAQGLNSEHAVLTELSVGLNGVGDDGAAEFAEMIRTNRSLREFYAEDNSINSFGAGLIAEALLHNDCLQTLWMVRNQLSVDVIAKFAHAVHENKVLRRLGLTSEDALPSDLVGQMDNACEQKSQVKPFVTLDEPFVDEPFVDDDEPFVVPRRMRCALGGGGGPRSPSPRTVRAALGRVLQVPARQQTAATAGGRRSPPEEWSLYTQSPRAALGTSPGPAERKRVAQQIVMWDDQLQVQELLQMASECPVGESRCRVHDARHAPPVDLAECPVDTASCVQEDSVP